jgi:alpha-1,3/alpha-1,6-mannosyltransferase
MSIARLVIYTPTGEHFGIVPIESMFVNTPVLAVNNGGPTETIIDKRTGFLCPPDQEKFAESMELAINEPELMKEMGILGIVIFTFIFLNLGRQNVEKKFSFNSFSDKLDDIVGIIVSKKNSSFDVKNDKKD